MNLNLYLFIYINLFKHKLPSFQPSQVYQHSGSVFSFRVDANAFFLPLCREALPVAYLLIQVLMSVTPVRQLAWPHLWQVHWDQCRVGAMSETVTLAMREEFGPTGKSLGLLNSGYEPQGATRISQGQQSLLTTEASMVGEVFLQEYRDGTACQNLVWSTDAMIFTFFQRCWKEDISAFWTQTRTFLWMLPRMYLSRRWLIPLVC